MYSDAAASSVIQECARRLEIRIRTAASNARTATQIIVYARTHAAYTRYTRYTGQASPRHYTATRLQNREHDTEMEGGWAGSKVQARDAGCARALRRAR